jgi:hypothetical protein
MHDLKRLPRYPISPSKRLKQTGQIHFFSPWAGLDTREGRNAANCRPQHADHLEIIFIISSTVNAFVLG